MFDRLSAFSSRKSCVLKIYVIPLGHLELLKVGVHTIWCQFGHFHFVQKDVSQGNITKVIKMKSICFAIHPCIYTIETPFPFYNIPGENDGIAKLGYKIVFKRGNRYTCLNTCKSVEYIRSF